MLEIIAFESDEPVVITQRQVDEGFPCPRCGHRMPAVPDLFKGLRPAEVVCPCGQRFAVEDGPPPLEA